MNNFNRNLISSILLFCMMDSREEQYAMKLYGGF